MSVSLEISIAVALSTVCVAFADVLNRLQSHAPRLATVGMLGLLLYRGAVEHIVVMIVGMIMPFLDGRPLTAHEDGLKQRVAGLMYVTYPWMPVPGGLTRAHGGRAGPHFAGQTSTAAVDDHVDKLWSRLQTLIHLIRFALTLEYQA
jgi:hypothetical protein